MLPFAAKLRFLTGQSVIFLGVGKLSERRGDLGESISQATEFAAGCRAVELATIHAQEMAGGGQGIDQGRERGKAFEGCGRRGRQWRNRITVRHVLACQGYCC